MKQFLDKLKNIKKVEVFGRVVFRQMNAISVKR